MNLVLLVSLVGWVCSSRAQKEGKKAAATLSVSFLDTPSSTALKSWLVVAAARRRDSNWFGTSAGSIGKRPAPSGGPGSAWAAGAERRTTGQIGWVGTKNTRRQGGGSSMVP